MKNKILFSAMMTTLVLVSCEKPVVSPQDETQRKEISANEECVIETDLPTYIDDYTERANPYAVHYMEEALEFIRTEISHPCGLPNTINISDIAFSITIQPTDYYIALYPNNAVDYESWADTSLVATMPYPLLLDNIDGLYGNYTVYLSDIEQEAPVLYGVCSADSLEQLDLSGVDYQIIEELFVPENSNQLLEYMQWYNDPDSPELIEMDEFIREQRDFAEAITHMAFRLAGYETQEIGPVEETECEVKYFLWWSWTDCDTYHHPTGQIKIETPNGMTGVSGIKVRLFRWFVTHDVYTDGNGQYYDRGRWKKLLLTDEICYTIKTEGRRNVTQVNEWNIKTSMIQGAVPLWTYGYNCGFHSSTGYSVDIYHSASTLWGRCVINNAIYDYCVYAENENLSLPPVRLNIASSSVEEDNGWVSSCPLLQNHLNLSLLDISYVGFYLEMLYIGMTPILYPILPDLILKFEADLSCYNKTISIVWHELTHSSHFMRTVAEYGYTRASIHWSDVIAYEVNHTINDDGRTYGTIGDDNWELIALTEGWAYYREWYMGNAYLGYNNYAHFYFGSSQSVAYCYAQYYRTLYNNGIDMHEMEQALAYAYTLAEFKSNLQYICPHKNNIINICLP